MSTEREISGLFRRFAGMVRGRARHLLRDDAAADDVVQEVFIRVLEFRRRNGSERDTAAFLFRTTTNLALNRLRDGRRRLKILQSMVSPSTGKTPPLDDQLTVLKILSLASGLEAQMAVHYYFDGMDHDEIALVMGLSRRTVGNRLERFRQRAQRRLEHGLQRLRSGVKHG
jgi:RNA polymerase sigma-70 factor (ECF subfamily)